MAITYKPNSTKQELLEIATKNGIDIDSEMTKPQIIAALDTHNAARGAETSAATNDTADGENAAQSGADGAESNDPNEYNMFVYVGPTLPNGQLKENSVFRGIFTDILKYLANVLEQYPQAAKLIVPTHKLGTFSVKVKTPGNIANKYYNDIVSAMRNHKEV